MSRNESAAEYRKSLGELFDSTLLKEWRLYLEASALELLRRPTETEKRAVIRAARPIGFALATPLIAWVQSHLEESGAMDKLPTPGSADEAWQQFNFLQQNLFESVRQIVTARVLRSGVPRDLRPVLEAYGSYASMMAASSQASADPTGDLLQMGMNDAYARTFSLAEILPRLSVAHGEPGLDLRGIFERSTYLMDLARLDPDVARGAQRHLVGCVAGCYSSSIDEMLATSAHARADLSHDSDKPEVESFKADHAMAFYIVIDKVRLCRTGTGAVEVALTNPLEETRDPRTGQLLPTSTDPNTSVIGCPALRTKAFAKMIASTASLCEPLWPFLVDRAVARKSVDFGEKGLIRSVRQVENVRTPHSALEL